MSTLSWSVIVVFQSTHPVRGATFNNLMTKNNVLTISIHAPREGCDARGGFPRCGAMIFQSTHPVRGATHAFVAD